MKLPSLARSFSALIIGVSAIGCDSIDNVDVPITAEVTIQGSMLGGLISTFPQSAALTRIDISQSAEFKNQGYTVDQVDSIRLKSLSMTVIEPAGSDLSFLGAVTFSAETEALPKKEIASRADFPPGVAQVAFTTSGDDLKNYLLAERGNIVTDATDSREPSQNTRIRIDAVFDVDVNVGALF